MRGPTPEQVGTHRTPASCRSALLILFAIPICLLAACRSSTAPPAEAGGTRKKSNSSTRPQVSPPARRPATVGNSRRPTGHREARRGTSSTPPLPYRGLQTDARNQTFFELAVDGHVHSHYSGDAILPPARIVRLARSRKLDAIVFTDHSSFAVSKFEAPRGPRQPLVLFGMEAGTAGVHIGVWNLTRKVVVPKRSRNGVQLLIAMVREQPDTLLVLNHPGWRIGERLWKPATFRGGPLKRLDAVELWNGTFWQFVEQNIRTWEGFLSQGLFVPAVGNSDNHYFQLGRPHNVLLVKKRDARSIVAAARVGRGYMTDDMRLNLNLGRALFGQILRVDRAGDVLTLKLAGKSRFGGLMRIYHRRRKVRELQIKSGAFMLSLPIICGDSDGWIRVEVLREKEIRKRKRFTYTLITNPIRYDVPPYDDFWESQPNSPIR